MEEPNLIDKLLSVFWYRPLSKIEYYFAKKWLDKTFGKQEYWGEYIQELIQERNKP